MILGRFLGVFTGIVIASFFAPNIIVWLLCAILGTIASMVYSTFIGPQFNFNNRPLPHDSKEYWTNKYGKEMGETAYKLYLSSLSKD